MPKGKPSKAMKTRGKGVWGSSDGWKVLDVEDGLLLGAEEGGFAGLEVLEDVTLLDAECLASLNQAAAQQPDAELAGGKGKTTKASKRQQQVPQKQPAAASTKKRKMLAAAAGSAREPTGTADDVTALKAKLAALEAENKALKKQKRTGKSKQQLPQHTAPQAAAAEGEIAGPEVAGTASGDVQQQPPQQQPPQLPGLSRKQRKLEQRKQKAEHRKQLRLEKAKQAKQLQKAAGPKADDSNDPQQQQQQQQQLTDMSAWSRFNLHPDLEAALAAQGFSSPTPIQDAVLLPAIRDRRDVIGAAETGSGKTLAFGLPILQVLLQEEAQRHLSQGSAAGIISKVTPPPPHAAADNGDTAGGHDGESDTAEPSPGAVDDAAAAAAGGGGHAGGVGLGVKGRQAAAESSLRALILAPTRELALQVCQHLQVLGKQVGVRVIGLVGGIAPVKQDRLLRQKPPVVVATPGRLWDLMRQGQQHLCDLSRLSFFVLDEADRMVQQGHYQELTHVLSMLPTAERAAAAAAAASAEAQEHRLQQQKADEQRQKQQTSAAEDREDEETDHDHDGDPDKQQDVTAEDPALQQQQQQQPPSSRHGKRPLQETVEEAEEDHLDFEQGAVVSADEGAVPGHKQLLQTFVFSATLTLPAQLHKRLRRGGGGSSGAASLDSLMDRLCFRPRPAIVDLSPSTRLAGRVNEGLLRCLEGERDACLYYLLARHPGKALVFVNAVSAVRRLAALLQLLGLPAGALHAQQQQRQRLKALDRFKTHPHGVLVATDVAARGLDIPDVQIVVHYQLPASADTYIHRSGRTARTGGTDGAVLAVVTPGDAARWSALRKALEGQQDPPDFPIDDQVLSVAKQRVVLAAKIDAIQRQDRKQHAQAIWAKANAAALGIELSDSSDEENLGNIRHSAVAAAGARGSNSNKRRKSAAVLAAAAAAATNSQAQSQIQATGQLAGHLMSLQRQLSVALSAPLQPSISHKFFTGGLSRAAVAAAAAAAVDDVKCGAADAPHENPAADASQPLPDAASKAASALPADAIAETMKLAAKLSQSRSGRISAAGGTGIDLSNGKQAAALAAAAQEKAAQKARCKAAAAASAAAAVKSAAVLKTSGRKGKAGALQKQGLAKLLMSRNEIKRQKRRGGMVVVRPGTAGVGGTFGRDTAGPSALDVLNTGSISR